MASIIQVDGKWRATVRVKRDGKMILNRTKSFASKRHAMEWASKIEAEASANIEAIIHKVAHGTVTFGALVDRYSTDFDTTSKPFGETKRYIVRILSGCELAGKPVQAIKAADIIGYIKNRQAQHGGMPSTLYQYANIIHQIFTLAKPVWGVDVPMTEADAAIVMLKKTAIVKTLGNERDRRLMGDEYQRISAWLSKYDQDRAKEFKAFTAVFQFAVVSAFRLGEICRIRWADVNPEKRTVIIRDRKDPREKAGNDQVVPLLTEAWAIVQAQPRTDEEIFPARVGSVSNLFIRCCEALGIEDLHFHDLRHEGTSRLFEAGYQIQEVALVTGHKNWKSLQRYTQIKPESLHRD
jgi:integrase